MDAELEVWQRLAEDPLIFDDVASAQGSELHRQQQLRARHNPELVRVALLLTDLRKRGQAKFERADRMWFDRTSLEQSTPELVARHKAQRFEHASPPVWDLCSGMGSDSIALAASVGAVVSVDASPLAGWWLRRNAEAYGVEDRIKVRCGDVTNVEIPREAWVHIDPDRRAGRKRAIRIEDYMPSLEFLQELMGRTAGGAIKLSPASNFGGKFPETEIELISLNGECKEATVWYGAPAGEATSRATVLPSGWTLAGNPWDAVPMVGELGTYVYDPDPAVVRAGLVDLLAEQLELQRLDDSEEYLTSSTPIASPAVTCFEVLADLSRNDREVRNYFRDHPVGEVEIKSRHVPCDAEAIRRKLPLNGTGRATMMIARVGGRTRTLVCRRVASC